MAQISRPFQIAFAAVALLAAVWLFALRGHSSSPETSSPPAAQPASHPATAAKPASTGPTAPGVAGLSKDVAKARGAVAASEKNAAALEHKSAQASGESANRAAAPVATKAAKPHTTTAAGAVAAPAASAAKPGSSSRHGTVAISRRQLAVESTLAHGGVALILFWNPHATDDRAVHSAMRQVAKRHDGVVAFQATGQEVATFGSVTRGVQVYGTPTMLVVGHSRQAHVLTGLTDPFSIEQTISEVRAH